ncbi:hypothetical protein EUX98_g2570 [Antrodiella citrinella]|uniref:Pyruvate decarboxylase n=1 Tax=Antrodiella citrinella TaxID=2447956 RepID=A0A4S4N6Z5_9APHY|nr:hypothetical protein EUX98_g2570 [Antrodiella citrinella]
MSKSNNSITGGGIFLKTLAAAGITHVFVNWGNDHPSFLEELEKERLTHGKNALEIITSPNEMVAMSAAQGYAQISGKPAAVIVHVDVGTQSLGAAVHNADKGRVPVLVFSGAPPHSAQGELKGSKNEWPMWGQDVPDQSAIVRQYMRYTAQVMSAKTIAKVTLRALQFATSQPRGPVYLYARRDVLEEDVDASLVDFTGPNLNPSKWPSVLNGGLSPTAVQTICQALNDAKFPLLITGGTERNSRNIPLLQQLSLLFAIAVQASCPTQTCVSYSCPTFIGSSYGGKNTLLEEADVILCIDTDLPWVDVVGNAPKEGARVFIVDSDPLKPGMTWAHTDAEMICRADTETVLKMLLAAASDVTSADKTHIREQRLSDLTRRHQEWINELTATEISFQGSHNDRSKTATAPNAFYVLQSVVNTAINNLAQSQSREPGGTIWLDETASNHSTLFNHIRMMDTDLTRGSMVLASGGSGLGWILGASIGVAMGAGRREGKPKPDLIVAVVGDGTFIFGVPTAAYWMARRYNAPFLTVVINNGGWASPKASMMGVYPTGAGSAASGSRLTVGLGPEMVDFGGVAAAAGGAWSGRAELWNMEKVFEDAIRAVLEEKRCAVVDCVVEPF